MHFSQRHLPHLYIVERPLFVTFCLHGGLPSGRQFTRESTSSGKAFVCMDRLLENNRSSPAYLMMTGIAQCVADAIQQGVTSYALHAWVIMPNHVHLLITPRVDVSKLLQKLKGSTARQANQLLGRTGAPFWQEESYDRLVRNSQEFAGIENYIVQNPVRAGLAGSAEEYPWSSASKEGGLKPAAG